QGGVHSKAQLFLNGDRYVVESYGDRLGWTSSSIIEKYGVVMETGVFEEMDTHSGILADELEMKGPTPLISVHEGLDSTLFVHNEWKKGLTIIFTAVGLNIVQSLVTFVVNFIPAQNIVGIIIPEQDKEFEVQYRELLKRNGHEDIEIKFYEEFQEV